MDLEWLKAVIGPVLGALIGATIAGLVNYAIFVRIATRQKQKELCVQMHSIWLSTDMWQMRQEAWRALADHPEAAGVIDLERLRKDNPAVYDHIGAICRFIEAVTVLLSSPSLINSQLAKRLFGKDFRSWLTRLDQARFPQPYQDYYNRDVKVAWTVFKE